MRHLFSLALASAFAASLSAQTTQPPSQATLDKLGLRSEWVSAVPLTGERDGIATIQVADHRQVFVQTRSGSLAAFDTVTGERQWIFRNETADANPFAVGWNDRYVFAISVTKLYGIQRVNGVIDFTQKLPLSPSTAPIADADTVYVVMAGNRLAAYQLPAALAMPDPEILKAANKLTPGASGQMAGIRNPADVVASRYPGTSRAINTPPEAMDSRHIVMTTASGGVGGLQPTASLAVVATLRPPFRSFDDGGRYLISSPSLAVNRSMRQPYHLDDPTGKNVQRTPSIAVIPPSLASLHESTNLRPRGIELKMRWIYGSATQLSYTPLLTRSRIWGLTNSTAISALDRADGASMIDARLSARPTAQATQADDIGYMPQEDGYLAAIDLSGGSFNAARFLWKANVGGLMNAPPVPTKNGVFQSGSHAGIARVDFASGEVVWRTDRASDRILAINDEHVYAQDSHGKVYVFDRNRINDPLTKRAFPLAVADLVDFNVTVTNSQTDRIFLASSTGLFVCLRDASPKYMAAQTIAPPRMLPPPPRAGAAKP